MLRMAWISSHFQYFSTQNRDMKTEKDHDLTELKKMDAHPQDLSNKGCSYEL